MIRVRQIRVSILKDNKKEIIKKISLKLNIKLQEINDINIIKKSIDSRNKNNICYVYEVDVDINNETKLKFNNDVFYSPDENYRFYPKKIKSMSSRPIIVGSGPSGLFCAYMLSSFGFKPIVIERGEKVEKRIKSVEEFWNNGKLNENSNVQFGEGGAGTFSDGKLNTLVKDERFIMKKVFEIFVECGAPKEILYENKPHIGTDILRDVIINMRNKIIKLGGEFRYNTKLTDLIIEDNAIKKIKINDNEMIDCENLVLAIGHSARDTFKMLYERGINMISKPFAVGIRIQHPQSIINDSQYGKYSNLLKPASYKLTYQSKSNRGVYSFCMCPGGYVVNSSSEEKYLAINGMSNNKRDSENANSAIVVQVTQEDFGLGLFDGVNFQRQLEKKSYEYANGKIPIQLFKDFINNQRSTKFGKVKPVFKGSYSFSNINDILPKFICDNIKEAMEYFGKKIQNFDMDDAIISAVESRTSSPIRIIRDENYMCNIKGIYPIGEGAGYAGGITTSAMDGIRCFEKIISD